jgi:hypothetical protein
MNVKSEICFAHAGFASQSQTQGQGVDASMIIAKREIVIGNRPEEKSQPIRAVKRASCDSEVERRPTMRAFYYADVILPTWVRAKAMANHRSGDTLRLLADLQADICRSCPTDVVDTHAKVTLFNQPHRSRIIA